MSIWIINYFPLINRAWISGLRSVNVFFYYWRAPQQILQTHRSLEGLLWNPVMKMVSFFLLFHFNGTPVEWNLQGKTEVLGEKPVQAPLCRTQIPHGTTQGQTRASAMTGRRLTAWNTARPYGYFLPTFRGSISVPSSRIKMSKILHPSRLYYFSSTASTLL